MVCRKCRSLCDSGAVMLKDGGIICSCCIYKHLGGDTDDGEDWPLAVIEDTAYEIAAQLDKEENTNK